MSCISFHVGKLAIGIETHDDFLGFGWGTFVQPTGRKTWYFAFLWTTVVFVDLRGEVVK